MIEQTIKFKQYRIDDLIKDLKKYKTENGNVLVAISADQEMNYIFSVGKYIRPNKDVLSPLARDNKQVIICPCEPQPY